MAVSGVDTWNPVLLDIIRDALINATAIDENENPSAALYQDGLRKLNGLVKTAEATGLHVWAEEEGILFPQPLIPRYRIGGSAFDAHTSDADDWLRLTLAANAAVGATTITVDDALTVADGDHVGVIVNDGTTQWTTAVGAPVSDVITLADALLVAATSGAFVITYTTEITRPLKVPAARLMTLQNYNETPMTILSRQGYMDLPQKIQSASTPTQWFYSPRRDDGLFYIWPVEGTSAWAVRFTWYRPLQDFLLPTNTSDFPQEWVLPLTWNLAREMAVGYGVPEQTWQRIVAMSETHGMTVISYDRESEPIQFGMDYQFDTEG